MFKIGLEDMTEMSMDVSIILILLHRWVLIVNIDKKPKKKKNKLMKLTLKIKLCPKCSNPKVKNKWSPPPKELELPSLVVKTLK